MRLASVTAITACTVFKIGRLLFVSPAHRGYRPIHLRIVSPAIDKSLKEITVVAPLPYAMHSNVCEYLIPHLRRGT